MCTWIPRGTSCTDLSHHSNTIPSRMQSGPWRRLGHSRGGPVQRSRSRSRILWFVLQWADQSVQRIARGHTSGAALTTRERSAWAERTLRRAGVRVRARSACNAVLAVCARVPCRAGLAAGRIVLAGGARRPLREYTDRRLFVWEEAAAAEVGISTEKRDGRFARRCEGGGCEGE